MLVCMCLPICECEYVCMVTHVLNAGVYKCLRVRVYESLCTCVYVRERVRECWCGSVCTA